MIITETGILVSTDPNMRDPVPLNFKIEGGQVGDNTVRATGLTGNTTYYAQSYFVKDGIYIRQAGVTEFKTASQAEVLKIKNAYAGSNRIGINNTSASGNITLDYSTDQGETWSTWSSTNGNFSVNLPQDGEVWLKGNNDRFGFGAGSHFQFVSTQIFDCEGNLRALLRNDITVLPDWCFYRLFYSSKIRTAPDLPADVDLSPYCYNQTFNGCTLLTSAPLLPYTTLYPYCYLQMFQDCTSLTQAPALPATTLSNSCCQAMFQGCTALVQAPALPATTLFTGCYAGMFRGCSSLAQAPALPATTLAQNCYGNMFNGCTALTQAPALPATTLAQSCYQNMFNGCTALTQAPALPATTLAQSCYQNMFYGCTSLNRIVCYAQSWNTSYANNWVNSVAAFGDFYNLGGATIPIDSVNGVPIGWTLHTSLHDPLTITNGESGQNTITLTKTGSPQDITLEYSTDDGSTWTSWSSANGNLSVTIEDGESVMLRGNNSTFSNGDIRYDTDYYNFGSTGEFSLSGDIMSLLADNVVAVPSWCFFFAFYNSKVTTVSSGLLSSEQLSMGCYYGMFRGCSLLTQAPALHSTQLAAHCYSNMFRSCSSLTQAPALPATTLASSCYQSMFAWCTSLTQAPELPATQIAGTCYANMLEHTAITRAPELPATQLTTMCYYMMFYGCSSLTQAPELPATTLAGSCYQDMFYGCTSVDRIVTYASDISAPSCISLWLGNVSATGDFYNLGGATYPSGDNGIPTGWTEHTSL